MARRQSRKAKRRVPKTVLRLPDLDQAKSAVLNSLSSSDAQRGYRHAIEEFIEWYCSEPRLSFSNPPVSHAPGISASGTRHHQSPTRRGAPPSYEASDCGLLSPDLAAGIRRVKGVKKIGVRLGNWLTPEQSERLWNTPDSQLLKGKRDRALLAVLLACGLRRHEAVNLNFSHVQQREDHWGHRRFEGQRRPHQDRTDARLGQGFARRMASGRQHMRRQVVSARKQEWESLGRWTDGKSGLARGPGARSQSRHREARATRPSPHVCPALPFFGWRTGADSISPRARLHSNDRAVPRLQAAHSRGRQ